eukprot:9867092-Lingulodinium_polyedra.AAC.1
MARLRGPGTNTTWKTTWQGADVERGSVEVAAPRGRRVAVARVNRRLGTMHHMGACRNSGLAAGASLRIYA